MMMAMGKKKTARRGGRGVPVYNPHDLISQVGVSEAKARVTNKFDRTCIDAAEAFVADPDKSNDLMYGTVLATVMPHRCVDRQFLEWRQETDTANFILTGGVGPYNRYFGVPYGSKARLILLYLFSRAVHAQSPIVDVGETMHEWVGTLGNQKFGGMTYKSFSEQAERLGACRLTVVPRDGSYLSRKVYNITDEMQIDSELLEEQSAGDGQSVPTYLKNLGRMEFPRLAYLPIYEDYKAQSFPIRRSALRQISNNSCAIDVYLELCDTLPRLKGAQLLSWDTIKQSMGTGYRDKSQVRRAYLRTLRLALAVYPQAKVDIVDSGVVLYPCAPPIAA